MYRLLIADDEALEREGLELLVNRMLPGVFQVIHAENGRIAIEKAEEYRPHIVLMDIKMPGIHGLDALKEIKASNPQVKMVLVTAYEQFDYAKQAVSLGVKEYMSKPVHREELIGLLRKLVQELEQEQQSRRQELAVRENFARLNRLAESELALSLMTHYVHESDAAQLLDILELQVGAGCAIVVAFPEFQPAEGSPVELEMRKAYELVRNEAKRSSQPFHIVVSPLIEEHMAVFLAGEPEKRDALPDEALLLGGKLAEIAASWRQTGVSVGIGSAGDGADGLRRSYYEAVFASTSAGSGQVCQYDRLKRSPDGSGTAADGGTPSAEQQEEPERRSYVQTAIQRIREERDHQTLNMMDRAAAYIRDHFREELSLEQVAEHVHLNPYYFSKVFKQYKGESFVDYMTRMRIEEAMALIAAGTSSLKEICYEVGYKDPNYFSRVFKKVTGVTPSDYRSQYGREHDTENDME